MKPAASKIRELAQKKRSGTQVAKRQAKKKRSAEEASWDSEVGPSAPMVVRESPIEDLPVVLSLDSPTHEEASTERTLVSPTLIVPVEEPVALAEEPVVETREAECPTKISAEGAPRVASDGPFTTAGSSSHVEGERDAWPSHEERQKWLEKVGLTPKEFDGLFVSDEPRTVDLWPLQDSRAFGNADLAEAIMKAVLLPKDREETRKSPLEESAKTIFSDLLKVGRL